VPLTATRNGTGFEVAWLNKSGEPYITQSRNIVEVRVFLSLSCADDETRNKLEEDWQNFMAQNKRGTTQSYWATVDITTTLGPASEFKGRRAFALSGVPKWLSVQIYYRMWCCMLGWLYRLLYATQHGVVELHLHRSLSIRGFNDGGSGGDRTRETDRSLQEEPARFCL
jgi:hypothetical protein